MFLTNRRSDCYGHSTCNCPRKSTDCSIFMENIYDVAETLAQIMVICGIHEAKAKSAIDVIIFSFLHYDEIRHRIDTVPRKRLCKEDLIHDLGSKCLMSRMEAQLTYSIMKRAFKAFYHGTTEGGIRNPILEAQLILSQECLWVHAAKRTAQIFASYEGMFFSAQKNYESLIKCVYKKLYDRMQSRTSQLVLKEECSCGNCVQRTVVGELPKPSESMYTIYNGPMAARGGNDKTLPVVNNSGSSSDQGKTSEVASKPARGGATKKAPKHHPSNTSINLPRCYKCNCPRLICDCNVDKVTGLLNEDCSQGPYKCQWVRIDDDDEDLKKTYFNLPQEHECPIDCNGSESVLCDSECECDCECCECQPEEYASDSNESEPAAESKVEEEGLLMREPTTTSTHCNISENSVPIAHVIEEQANQPITIARISGYKKAASLTTTDMEGEKVWKLNKGEEINKLLGTMF